MGNALAAVAALVALSVLMGCASYYRVQDPQSGKVYYTQDVDRNKSGSVQFEDANSGSDVTLQSSEVLEISKDEYLANTPVK